MSEGKSDGGGSSGCIVLLLLFLAMKTCAIQTTVDELKKPPVPAETPK